MTSELRYDISTMSVFDDRNTPLNCLSVEGSTLLLGEAVNLRFEKPTHRAVGFYRTADGNGDRFEKVLLEDKGVFWVTQNNLVYLKTAFHQDPRLSSMALFFTLPLVDNGVAIPRPPFETDQAKIEAIWKYPQIFAHEIKPYVEGEVPRAWTRDEMTRQFIHHLQAMVKYWDTLQRDGLSQRERMEGLLFSFLAALDGSSPYLPGFMFVPRVHVEDQAFHETCGDNWWPRWEGSIPEEFTLNYPLHEILSSIEREKSATKE